jgi:hypothetical protein
MSVRVKFVVDDMEMGQIYLRALRYPPVNIIPPVLPTYLHPRVALTRRPNGEAWERLEKQFSFGNRGALHTSIEILPLFSIFKG